MRNVHPGHALFAATLVALGIQGLATGAFTALWDPVPKDVPARVLLAYLSAGVALASGVGLLWRPHAATAARALLACLLPWMLVFRAPVVVRAPISALAWEAWAESAVVVAGAWVLYARLGADGNQRRLAFASGDSGVRIARTLYGIAMVVFGIAHFAYVEETASLVPAWLPAHEFWAYATGCAYVAAGVSILAGPLAKLAAALSALQMGLFTALVWVPIVAAGGDAGQWGECVLSWLLTTAGWVVADSYNEQGP